MKTAEHESAFVQGWAQKNTGDVMFMKQMITTIVSKKFSFKLFIGVRYAYF
jgi:hypothetical protein